VQEKQSVRVEKMCAFYTSRDHAISEPLINAERSVRRYPEFETALQRHMRAWDELWASCDVRIPKDDRVQKLVRFHIAHILQVCSPITADIDAGVPARGLNGEAYRGHVFWDELYIYPFINFRLPEITRELLMYRYRRLDDAREAAKEHGYLGAMYPWQSGSDGSEETQVVHLNPKSGRWDPDLSHNQRHVNAAIFYNIWEYYRATIDIGFIWDHGAEMMLEIARFWSSVAHYNEARDRYEIHGVMGPDELPRRRNIDYYERRTSHGSTLSYIVHADVAAELDPKLSWQRFKVALESDVTDIQGGTTKEGIHMGVMAGTLDLIQRGYLGTEIHGDVLVFAPKPIDELDGLALTMEFRKTSFQVSLDGPRLTVDVDPDARGQPLRVRVGEVQMDLRAGDSYTFRF
jgi:trehalose/maltose hydrolase-like predicted phosphorylase